MFVGTTSVKMQKFFSFSIFNSVTQFRDIRDLIFTADTPTPIHPSPFYGRGGQLTRATRVPSRSWCRSLDATGLRLKFIKAGEISAVLEMDSKGRGTHINRLSGQRDGEHTELNKGWKGGTEGGTEDRGGRWKGKEGRRRGHIQAPRRRRNNERVRRGWKRDWRTVEKEKRGESLMRATIQCVEHRPRGMQPASGSSIHKFIPAAFCQLRFIA